MAAWLAVSCAPQSPRDVLILGQSNALRVDRPLLAATMTGAIRSERVAQPGTGFQNGWTAPGGALAIEAAEALAAMRNPTAIAFVHGERDANHVSFSSAYESNARALLAFLWSSGGDETPVYVVALRPDVSRPYAATVRAAQERLARTLASVHLVICDDVPDFDGLHYGAEGAREMTGRLAAAMEVSR